MVKAQMELDQDELDDASEDLEQAGGDQESKIKRLQADHEAGDHNAAPAGSSVNPHEQDYRTHTLLNRHSSVAGLARQAGPTGTGQRGNRPEAAASGTATRQALRSGRKGEEKIGRLRKRRRRDLLQAPHPQATTTPKLRQRRPSSSLKLYTLDQKNLADLGAPHPG